MSASDLPEGFNGVAELEDVLSAPTAELTADLACLDGDILILGAAGKMGPSLARMAKRAAPQKRVIAIARFSDPAVRPRLEAGGVETIACDLLDRAAVEKLPRIANVVYMVGTKFGTAVDPAMTWAINVHAAAIVAERFAASRIVAFSTGCVYPFVPVEAGGATEATQLRPPSGDYAYSCVGRERLFEHFSRRLGTPGRILRLNYAIDMRYGVLHDVATKVRDGLAIDLTMGHVNVIWQGDANGIALRCLAHTTAPASPLNVTGPETISVRWLAEEFGRALSRAPRLVGNESATGWVSSAARMRAEFGAPRVSLARMIAWTADWVGRRMASHGKPTHYEARDGRF